MYNYISFFQPTIGSDQATRAALHKAMGSGSGAGKDPSSSVSKSMPSVGTGAGQVFSDIGYYKGVIVALKHIKKDHLQISREILLEFNDVSVLLPWVSFLHYLL